MPLAVAFAHRLADDGVLRGLIGPREAPRLWDRHLLNSAVVGECIPQGVAVADVGSGAGLPGLVLAIARPDLQVTLVEPLLRRTTFLEEVRESLALENVEVVRARAEELHGSHMFDLVTSRAVAPLPKLLSWCMPLVSSQGAMVALKGDRAASEAASCHEAILAAGGTAPEVRSVGVEVLEEPTFVVRVGWAGEPRVPWGARRQKPRRAPGSKGRRG
ncbi:16S rRNA (guanine(527)-N(7))-methyltransferase RsmG [Nocardioides acrostichi]|uniref:Ribosomal RNA small subunit methyltransferase G n=1 Tax=Nocardioides acrostichi TaxID=2784339 RepID=A0A930Y7Y8_9ACTN|nr:16S rRNA (guanine(527)-N(7))-methyltransferase RsmG [Nocardioides acrostichi]MBF4163940.1 16S rRNA (guanine(527)-N(7))-methyltransferase RsmG [Nocardioides acrostichi]